MPDNDIGVKLQLTTIFQYVFNIMLESKNDCRKLVNSFFWVLHSCGKTSTIVKPITTRNLNLYRTT